MSDCGCVELGYVLARVDHAPHFVYDNSETLRTYRIKMDNNNVYRTSDITYQVTTLSVNAMLSL